MGEVTKYLVYNTRKRQVGGDQEEKYFATDPLHFLGVTKIHNFISMPDMKYSAIVNTGIKIVNRVKIPSDLVPDDAQVEIIAKVYHGYNGGKSYADVNEDSLRKTVGRAYDYEGKEIEEEGVV